MNVEDAVQRIQELEEALRREKAKSAEYKETAYALLNQVMPYVPVTKEEAEKLQTETDGTSISQIIAELEREFAK